MWTREAFGDRPHQPHQQRARERESRDIERLSGEGEERSGCGGGERRGVVVGERRGVCGVKECVGWRSVWGGGERGVTDLGGARLRVYAVAQVVAVLAQHEEAVVRKQ